MGKIYNDRLSYAAVLVMCHMNGLKPFERTMEQTTEIMSPSHKTITAAAMTTNSCKVASLREPLHYRIDEWIDQMNHNWSPRNKAITVPWSNWSFHCTTKERPGSILMLTARNQLNTGILIWRWRRKKSNSEENSQESERNETCYFCGHHLPVKENLLMQLFDFTKQLQRNEWSPV